MAPSVSTPREATPAAAPAPAAPPGPAVDTDTARMMRERLRKLRAHVEANSDYVGTRFVEEARRMHAGDTPERSIHGEARPEEARALLDDGVPVLPLPFAPKRTTN